MSLSDPRTLRRIRRGGVPLLLLIAGVAVLLLKFGDRPVTPLETRFPSDPATQVRNDISATVPFWDHTVPHQLELTVAPALLDEALKEYVDSGDKIWIPAEVRVDGTTVDEVGIRLKGNTSLQALALAEGVVDPAQLPWLLSFDHFVPGQRYDGISELALRPVGTDLAVGEAALLTLLGQAAEPTQRWSYAGLSLNGVASPVRLVVENPDPAYAAALGASPGVLYKARPSGEFAQVNRIGQQDDEPLQAFLDFVGTASDERFASDFAAFAEEESLARYLAVQSIFGNPNGLGGPGRNFYLFYDLENQDMQVVAWDLGGAMSDDPRAAIFPSAVNATSVLPARFLAVPKLNELYQQQFAELFEELMASGAAHSEVERIAQLLRAQHGVDATNEAAALVGFLDDRQAFLADVVAAMS